MNKKILIGSIIAVVILVLVSFTSVVGYNSVTSDVKASPLFTVEESKDLKYVDCDCISELDSNVELQDEYPVICYLLYLLFLPVWLITLALSADFIYLLFGLPIVFLAMALGCSWADISEPKIQGMINSNYTTDFYKTLLESS